MILFVDEIHRFNKAQQDAFLPHVESGLITLIGATTEIYTLSLHDARPIYCASLHLGFSLPSSRSTIDFPNLRVALPDCRAIQLDAALRHVDPQTGRLIPGLLQEIRNHLRLIRSQ